MADKPLNVVLRHITFGHLAWLWQDTRVQLSTAYQSLVISGIVIM